MLQVVPAGEHGRTAAGSDPIGNESVAGATSEVFARWLHHRYALAELSSATGISFRHAIPCLSMDRKAFGYAISKSEVRSPDFALHNFNETF